MQLLDGFFETHKAGVAHEVHTVFPGLKLYVTTMTATNVCPMCETFSDLGNSPNQCGAGISKWEVFNESIRPSLRMGGKEGERSTFRMS